MCKRLGGAEDIAFGSASNVDHSRDDEPLKWNPLAMMLSIGTQTPLEGTDKKVEMDPFDYLNSIGANVRVTLRPEGGDALTENDMRIYGPAGPDGAALFEFGGKTSDDSACLVVTDNRSAQRPRSPVASAS